MVWGAMNSEHLFGPISLMDLSIILIIQPCLKSGSYHNYKVLELKTMSGTNKMGRQLILQ